MTRRRVAFLRRSRGPAEFCREWQSIEYDESLALEAGQFAPDWTDVASH